MIETLKKIKFLLNKEFFIKIINFQLKISIFFFIKFFEMFYIKLKNNIFIWWFDEVIINNKEEYIDYFKLFSFKIYFCKFCILQLKNMHKSYIKIKISF